MHKGLPRLRERGVGRASLLEDLRKRVCLTQMSTGVCSGLRTQAGVGIVRITVSGVEVGLVGKRYP